MRKLLFLLVIGSYPTVFYAQAPEYDDLKIMYADGKYEKLVATADKYSNKDDLKKDPFPSIWLAKGLYKISTTSLVEDEKFKNAYKESIAALARVIKLDKDSNCINTHRDFVDEFQMGVARRVEDALSADKLRDASGWATKYYKITKNPIGAKYIESVGKFRNSDKGGAAAIWKECEAMMSKINDLETWSEADKLFFRMGILQAAECQLASRQQEKAINLLNKVAPWFGEDEEFKTRYNEIVN
jgi:hypothetical protein